MRIPRHGTRTMYVGHRCRCARCMEANRVYQRNYLRQRKAQGLVDYTGKRLDPPG